MIATQEFMQRRMPQKEIARCEVCSREFLRLRYGSLNGGTKARNNFIKPARCVTCSKECANKLRIILQKKASKEVRERRKAYQVVWRAKNPEKIKLYNKTQRGKHALDL